MRSAHVMGIMVLHRELGQEKLSWPLAHQATVNQDNAVASVTAIYSLIVCFWYVSNMSESKAANHVASNTRATISGSPVKKSLQGGLPHNPTKRKFEDIRRDMERELRGLWLGPMPVEDFMKEFLPLRNNSGPMREVPPDLFQNLPSTGDKTMPSKLVSGLILFTLPRTVLSNR